MSVRISVVCAAVLGVACAGRSQTVYWNFNTDAPTSGDVPYVTASAISRGNGGEGALLSTSSASSGYTGASGSSNAVASAGGGALVTNQSAYFQFTLTPEVGTILNVTNLTVGSRSTGTGPQAFSVRSSVDGFAVDIVTGTLQADSTWFLIHVVPAFLSSVDGEPVIFRLYGYNGSGGSSNWRIDDLTVWAAAAEPGTTTPPVIDPVGAQSVRIGQTLTFGLTITPTDDDPITATNVSASAGVTGVWSLENGVFTYAPALADVGEQSFTFTATDKDGVSSPVLVPVTVRRTQVPAVSFANTTGSYTQDFDTLEMSGTPEWDNAAYPLEAWYAYTANEITSYRTGTGTGTAGGLYSWGTDSDRSLGSLASSGNAYRYGVAFTNETGEALTNLTVSFTAEQWRVGANAATNTLVFEVCVTNRVLPLTAGVWRTVRALCFDTPLVTNDAQSAGAAYASAARSAAFTRPVPAGAVVLLRWSDADDTGNDHGFGIDDLAVAWAAGEPPDAVAVGLQGASEGFDEMGSGATDELPWLWRVESRDDAVRTSGSYAGASDRTMRANAVANFTDAGSYNFAATAAGDQAVGGLGSDAAAKSVTLFGKFRNTAGRPVRRWNVAYDVEKYRNGLTGCAVRLLLSADGETWTAVGEPTVFAADADTNGYAVGARPGATVAVERTASLDAPLANGGVFYLAWQVSAAEGDSAADAQALGVDDVLIAPDFPSVTVFLLE
jgi:hypothetical protein